MLCKKPFRKGVMEYGCGQCMPCRINKSREWVSRLMMESMEHKDSCFLTLTFSEEYIGGASLEKRPLQLFIKRLRFEFGERKIRYFAVGEYGDQTWRKHYHLLVFGVSYLEEERIRSCWPFGFVSVGTADIAALRYIVGYVQKKYTKPGLPALKGRSPEFAVMSRKPGLGSGYVEKLRKVLTAYPNSDIVRVACAKSVRVAGKKYPLGRYLREKVVKSIGLSEDQKEDIRIAAMCAVAERKAVCTTTEYEVQRAARVSQQNYGRKGGYL